MQNNNLLYSYLAPLTTNLYQFVGEFFPQVLLVHIGPYPELLLVNVTTFWQSNMAMENSPSIYIYWFSHWNLHLVCELSSQPRLTTRGYLSRFSQDRSSRSNFVEVSTCDSLTGLGLFTSAALLQALGRWGIGERMLNIIPNSHDVSTNKILASINKKVVMISVPTDMGVPVMPHKAVAEVSKIENL